MLTEKTKYNGEHFAETIANTAFQKNCFFIRSMMMIERIKNKHY